jgi:SAM-dependent methyltransferase
MKVANCIGCGSTKLIELTKRVDDNPILRCGACHLMMVGYLQDDTEAMYSAEYFEKDEGSKFGYSDYLSSPTTTLIGKFGFARLFSHNDSVHLDLGSADGSLMEIFEAYGQETYGLEISQDAVGIAVDKGLKTYQSNLKGFPKAIQKVDVVTAYDLLEHADAPGVVVDEVHRVLNPDGVFVFSTLSVDVSNPEDHWLNNSLEHYAYYDSKALATLLERAFGAGNYGFVEIKNNGIAEFWGFAKKGNAVKEKKIIESIGKVPKNLTPEKAYMLSLFYDQVLLKCMVKPGIH